MSGSPLFVAIASLVLSAAMVQADGKGDPVVNPGITKQQSAPLSLAAWEQPEEQNRDRKSETSKPIDETGTGRSGEASSAGESDSNSASAEKSEAGDPMEDIQSFNTYTQLEDGQPGQRGEWQVNYFNGWQTQSHESDPWLMIMEVEYSPDDPNSWLLSNAKFGIDLPLELCNGGVDGNGDVELNWKQRLIREEPGNWWPTVSIENAIRIPTGFNSSGVDWTFEGIVAKQVGPGTFVVNAFLTSANGHNNMETASWWDELSCDAEEDDLRHFQWGARLGYKWRLTDEFAIICDYINQSSELTGERNQNIGEVAAEWRITDHFTIGPGIMFGLDGQDTTPRFGAGVLVHYSW